jgi:uncharacterized membrane protein YfcA/uncharacterized membrane protein YedE/YeeE
MSPLGLCLSVLVGVALGFFGGGGSILTVPLLVYVFGLEPKQAIASSLLVVGAASVAGAVQHWRAGNVQLRTGLVFGAAAMAGAHAGGRAAAYLDGALLLRLFAAAMVLTAAAMWRGRRAPARAPAVDRSLAPLVAQGLGVGLFTGLVGAGGGFLIVPALALWAGLPMRAAVGTSLFVIVLSTLAGFSGYARHVRVDLALVAAVAGGGDRGLLPRRVARASHRALLAAPGLRGVRRRDGRPDLRTRDGCLARNGARRPARLLAAARLRAAGSRPRNRDGPHLAPRRGRSHVRPFVLGRSWHMTTTFSPLAGLVGGALIGLASAVLLLADGRIAGVSGILGGSLFGDARDRGWRLAFLVGLPLGAWLAHFATSDAMGFGITGRPELLVAGGLLVGFGTQLGSGCTSGHGVCGVARGSRRSIAATLAFMASGAVTVFVMRHMLGGA